LLKHRQEQISKHNSKQLEGANEFQKLLHDVFVVNKNGAKLLEQWLHIATFTDGFAYGKDAYDLGRIEGRKEFVREIALMSKQAEDR